MTVTRYNWMTDDELLSLVECRGFNDIHEALDELTVRLRASGDRLTELETEYEQLESQLQGAREGLSSLHDELDTCI